MPRRWALAPIGTPLELKHKTRYHVAGKAIPTNEEWKVTKDTWFSFARLEFETGSAALKPTSREQLRNIAEILKSYPNVAVKLGGYTDNTGSAAQNLKPSQDRANTAMRELVALGIDESRIAAEGYGPQFPVADNATEEGRQRNRRIDVRVTRR